MLKAEYVRNSYKFEEHKAKQEHEHEKVHCTRTRDYHNRIYV